jgi:hypothetical protein
MTHHHETHSKGTETRKRIFITRAQVLPEEKRSELTEKEKEFEKSCQDRGVWLEIFCPDDACMAEEERIGIPVFCEDPKMKKRFFFELFCPEDSCLVTSPSQLP